VISPADFAILRFADDAEGVWRELVAAGIDAAHPGAAPRLSDTEH
jgi:hypothetical protein